MFETLTQEYELAKVQEAKEIPTVKVLDPPNLPDKKSFPPRTLIVLLGTALAFSFGLTWIFGNAPWEPTDPADPRKLMAIEVFEAVRTALPWAGRNGFKTGPGSGVRGAGSNTNPRSGVRSPGGKTRSLELVQAISRQVWGLGLRSIHRRLGYVYPVSDRAELCRADLELVRSTANGNASRIPDRDELAPSPPNR